MSSLYFECNNGISGDMSVAALLDVGADRKILDEVLKSLKLENEFDYKISEVKINSVRALDFDVILKSADVRQKEHHVKRNLDDIIKIIENSCATNGAKGLAKKIFEIVAKAESKVHSCDVNGVHFHEIGAIDSIADILSFAVLYDSISPENVYFSPLTEGRGSVKCIHGELSVPVPAVCEILSEYQLPVNFSENAGEMITPTGAAIAAALYKAKSLPSEFFLEKVGYGAGKRKYKNPLLRVIKIKENVCI